MDKIHRIRAEFTVSSCPCRRFLKVEDPKQVTSFLESIVEDADPTKSLAVIFFDNSSENFMGNDGILAEVRFSRPEYLAHHLRALQGFVPETLDADEFLSFMFKFS